jgi:hypothetical protein
LSSTSRLAAISHALRCGQRGDLAMRVHRRQVLVDQRAQRQPGEVDLLRPGQFQQQVDRPVIAVQMDDQGGALRVRRRRRHVTASVCSSNDSSGHALASRRTAARGRLSAAKKL